MNDLFKKDLKIKVLSIFVALILWLYVYNTEDNPYNTRTFTNISLKIVNEDSLADKGIRIKNDYKKSIDITVRGRKDSLDKLRDSDFDATLDFSTIKSANDKAIIIIGPFCSMEGIEIKGANPNKIDLELTKIKDNTFPITINQNITLKQNYKIIKVTPGNDTVTLSNEEFLINSVGSVTASLDLKDLDRDVTKRVSCKVLNKDGKEIPALEKDLSVDITVEVAKEVPITLVANGKPDSNFVEVSRSVSPDKALITGSPDKLAAINELQTEPLDISNTKQNISTTAAIKLPAGVKLADTPKEVTVNITMEELVIKDFIIGKNDIALDNTVTDNTFDYGIKTESVTVQVKGRASELDQLSLADIKPSIDLIGLNEGVHKIPLNITLPTQIKQLQDVTIEVKVTKKSETGAV